MKLTPGGSVFLSCLLLTNLLSARPFGDSNDAPQAAPMLNIVDRRGRRHAQQRQTAREPRTDRRGGGRKS